MVYIMRSSCGRSTALSKLGQVVTLLKKIGGSGGGSCAFSGRLFSGRRQKNGRSYQEARVRSSVGAIQQRAAWPSTSSTHKHSGKQKEHVDILLRICIGRRLECFTWLDWCVCWLGFQPSAVEISTTLEFHNRREKRVLCFCGSGHLSRLCLFF